MKLLKTISLLMFLTLGFVSVGQTVYTIPDTNFRKCLATKYPVLIDSNQDLLIEKAQIFTDPITCIGANIKSIDGIEYFVKVEEVFLNNNNISFIKALPTSTVLKRLVFDDNKLTQLPDISVVPKLTTLVVNRNKLTSLPSFVSTPKLRQLYVSDNQLTSIPGLSNLEDLWAFTFSNNLLTELPVLDSLLKLEELVAAGNQLTGVQSLVNLPKLLFIDLSNNMLSSLPEVMPNNVIKTINIQNNIFSALPDFSVFPNLTSANINDNFFTFSSLQALESIKKYQTIFPTNSQAKINGGGDYTLRTNDTLVLQTFVDNELEGVQYNWYRNGVKIDRVDNDLLVVNTSSDTLSGNYWAELTYSKFPNLKLKTDTFKIQILPCLDSASFVLDVKPRTCIDNSANLQVTSTKTWATGFQYELLNIETNELLKSSNGVFQDLKGVNFTLIGNTKYCKGMISKQIKIEEIGCEDGGFITADGDGIDDVFTISETGFATISDKFGNRVMELKVPAQWDALGRNGKVSPGLYFVNINSGEKLIKITVVH